MSTSLEIAHIQNHCQLLGESVDTGLLASQINRLMQTSLPALIAEELAKQLPDAEHSKMVYRINTLQISMSLLKEDLQSNLASAIFAKRLILALRQALQNDSTNIKSYANEEEYVGSLMADLLRGTAWSQWQYQEFSALQHVDEDEAAIQILMTRPDTLAALLVVLTKQNALRHLYIAITPSRAIAMFEQWSKCKIEDLFKHQSLFAVRELRQLLSSIGLVSPMINAQEPLPVATIKTFLTHMQDTNTQPVNLPLLITLIAHRTFILRHHLLTLQYITDNDKEHLLLPQNLAVLDYTEQQILLSFKEFIVCSDEHKQYITLLHEIADSTVEIPVESKKVSKAQNNTAAQTCIYCEHAGLVLLIPVMVSLGLHPLYGAAKLRMALLNIAQADEDDPCYAWISWLLPLEDPEYTRENTDKPEFLPPHLLMGLNQEQRNELESLQGMPIQQLSRLLSMQFAVRLSGLQLSSARYLYEQFLHVSGNFTRDETGICVVLSPIALNIVLNMSGFSPWQQKLSWLNESLSIEVQT